MRTINQLVLTLLVNACWQVPLLAVMASSCAWLLKDSSARYRHWVWTMTLLLALIIPVLGVSPLIRESLYPVRTTADVELKPQVMRGFDQPIPPTLLSSDLGDSPFELNQTVVIVCFFFCGAIFLYRSFSLLNAARVTLRIRRNATKFPKTPRLTHIIESCKSAVGASVSNVEIVQSAAIQVPVTFGVFHPIIVLPGNLVHEGSDELITSAMGHEFVHVARRDYLLNLFYEILYLPLSFIPAASLIRRRIKQTRELCCDEIVAERILKADAYARSLVKLASSASPLTRLSVSTTVGIADADILEARIMSLLRKPTLTARWKKILLPVVPIFLLVPCVTAASFAMRFDVKSNAGARTQDPSQEQEQKEKAEKEQKERERTREMRVRTPEGEERTWRLLDESDPRVREETERKRELEMEMKEKTHAALVRLARITMEQAIQIATSQSPGKVLECSLIGERWEEPGKLAKDGLVLYHVVIVSGDENSPGATHVLVNAIDGSVFKVEKELPRKIRSAEPR